MYYSKKNLPNGMRIITVPMKDNPTITVMIMVEAGSKYESKNTSGISHFLEHMCFKGTALRQSALAVSTELDTLGAKYNAFTAQEFTGYYVKARAEYFEKVLDILSDLYLHPLIAGVEIEKEKQVITEEIKMYEDIPQHRVHDLFIKLLYGDTPAGWDISGTKDSVQMFDRDMLMAYRSEHYVSAATTVVVAGGFADEEKIKKMVEEKLSELSNGAKASRLPVVEKQVASAWISEAKKGEQTQLILGVRSFNLFDKRTPAANVVASILGGGMSSRLFQKLRNEMAAAYSVHAWNDEYTDHGYLAVGAGVDRKKLSEVIAAIVLEFERLREETVSEEELRRVKEHMIGGLLLELESSDSLSHFYAVQEVLRRPLLTPEEMKKEIERVTADDVKTVAREIFKEGSLNLALVGDVPPDDLCRKLLVL